MLAQGEEMPLGSTFPSGVSSLQQMGGGNASVSSLAGSKGTVYIFWSNQCPWVDKYEQRVLDLAGTYSGQGFSFVLVNANNPNAFPQESAEQGQEVARRYTNVSYVRDNEARLARALGASRTPHVFVFDGSNTLVYAGTIDDSPGDPGDVQKRYLANALDAINAGSKIPVADTKAFGCTIKY